MKICVAQTKPVTGDIQRNIENHLERIEWAVANGAQIIIFSELSLTGYEPRLADELATNEHDPRLDCFQRASDEKMIIIGVGIPTRANDGVCISLALFQPNQLKTLYSKAFLHADENAFFVSGERSTRMIGNDDCALAICYELSVPEHAEKAFADGAQVYIASVAKTASGVARAIERLADISREYSMTVLMANAIGLADGFQCAGKTSAWNRTGQVLAQLDDTREGAIILDTLTMDWKVWQAADFHNDSH